jgi:hypothetical protein
MKNKTEVTLAWEGPFSLGTADSRGKFEPPNEPGVYLWTIPKDDDFQIAYVGEAKDLAARLYQHFHFLLGGGYELYATKSLRAGVKPTDAMCEYKPGQTQLFQDFVGDFEWLSQLALRNLHSYRFFWAKMGDHDDRTRLLAESALIECAIDQAQPIQNERVSRRPNSEHPIRVVSKFDELAPSALTDYIEY